MIVGAAVAAGLFAMALALWPRTGFAPDGAVGTIQAVTLVGGQVYFGKLAKVTADSIVLTELVEGQTVTNPQNNQRQTQLVNRTRGAWH